MTVVSKATSSERFERAFADKKRTSGRRIEPFALIRLGWHQEPDPEMRRALSCPVTTFR